VAAVWWLRRPGPDRAADSSPPAGDTERASAAVTDEAAPLGVRDDSFGRQYRYSPSAPTNQVTGTVLDAASGQPVADVDVTFRRGRPETTATSAADGTYSVELAPGVYDVRAVGADVLALPQPQLKVGRLGDAVRYDVHVVRLATVRGTVSYSDGRPAQGAEVSVRANSEGAAAYVKTGELGGALTESDGSFAVRALPGTLELTATDGTLAGFVRVDGVQAGSTRAGVAIVLEDGAVVAGVVRDPQSRPVSGAEVTVSVRRPGTPQYERTRVETDGSGRFEVEVRAGRTVAVAVADGYAPAKEQAVVTKPGSRQEVELALQASLVLAGRVVDADGRPVADAVVSHLRYASKLPTERQTTGSDGRFSFEPVGPGPHSLVAELEGYGKARTEAATAPADDLVLELLPYGGLRGTVTAEDETPIEQFVAIVEQGGRPVSAAPASRFMAEDGRYEVFPLEPGRYDLIVFAAGYAPSRLPGVEVPPGDWGHGTVTLHAGGSIAGVVRNARTGAPIRGAKVSAKSGYRGDAATTARDGRFELHDVAPGKRILTASRPGFATLRSAEVEVEVAKETTVDLTLAPTR